MVSEAEYREYLVELYKNPKNFGRIDDADYSGEADNASCGDRIRIYLKVRDGKIEDVKFDGVGCALSTASASLFTDFLKGKSLDEVKKLEKEDILKLIKIDLSKNPTRMRCALIPLDAIKKALEDK